jgi:hypothetical protein
MLRSPGRELVLLLGGGTVVFGVAPMIMPSWFARLFDIPVTDDPRLVVMVRSIGARDAVIGLGLMAAALNRTSPRPWLQARIVSDVTDTLAVAAAIWSGARQPRFVGLGGIALGAACFGLWLDRLTSRTHF